MFSCFAEKEIQRPRMMTGNIGNLEKSSNQRQDATSAGNFWVVCNSKSRPGLKYYFNPTTGHAVWNLSPAEIKKAKKYTKGLPIAEIEKCPEPNTEPPMDYPMDSSHDNPQRDFKEQIINNRIPNMFPLNLLNSLPSVSGFNQNIWSNPPNNSTMAPGPQVIYVAYQPPMNFQQSQEYLQHLPTHYENSVYDTQTDYSSYRANNMHERGNQVHYNKGRNKFSPKVKTEHNRNVNRLDLRQKLIRKRSNSQSCASNPYEDNSYQDVWANFDNKGVQRITEEAPSKYDLSVLTKLKSPTSKSNNWFIVVDTEIILNNFPFLNKITDPDQNCYLFVPHHVMTELQVLASSGNDVRSRRIYRFLSAQIDSELAFKGEDMTDVADSDTEKTLATCVELAEQNNVILLSNELKFFNYKKNSQNIVVLTLSELKIILNEQIERVPIRTKSPTLDIKIVVSNQGQRERNEMLPSNQLHPKAFDFEVTPHVAKRNETAVQSSALSTSKLTKDSVTQAVESKNCSDEVDHAPVNPVINAPKLVGLDKRSENSLSLNNDRKKQIKLFRSYSTPKTYNEINAQTKQFRWRKQSRNTTHTNITPKSSSVTSEHAVNVENNKAQERTPLDICENPCNVAEVSAKITLSPPRAPSLERSSVSSQYKITGRPNVIVEETSTSGMISNTTLDCESINSDAKKTVSVCDDVNFEMFQVAGQSMEEVLRTRREEWVLRFVQIMEEVLREQLRDDSPFQSKEYAPPWATDLPELARCIIKKFSDHFNVVDAANRLSFTLQRISDNKGYVSANIEPGQFMDMYSFGVYLTESLKNVSKDCEDINVAEKSLKKLLLDIQNANLDSCQNDTFADELHESAVHAPELAQAEEELAQVFPFGNSPKETNHEDHIHTDSSKSSYTSRFRKETPTKNTSSPKQQTFTNEKTFFSSLELSKRVNSDKATAVKTLDFQDTLHSTPKPTQIPQTPQVPQSPKAQSSPKKQSNVPTTVHEGEDNNNKNKLGVTNDMDTITGEDQNTTNAVKTCFVRQFTSIAQFEDKLLNNSYDDENEDEYDYEDYDNEYYDQNGEMDIVENDLEDGEIAESDDDKIINETELHDSAVIEESLGHSDDEKNKKFRCFITEFIGEIKESFESVHKLCGEFVNELKNSHESSPDMNDKLRTACAAMLKISNYLNSILDRESRRPDNNIMLLLKKANLEDFVPNEELRLEYTDIISKCRDQAYTCYKTVTLIMKGAGIRKVV